MEQSHFIFRLGIAIFAGLLIGLQREYVYGHDKPENTELFAGARTFALFAILGFMAAFITTFLNSPLGFIAVFVVSSVLIVVSYRISAAQGNLGLTTEAAALITLLIGAICYWEELAIAAAIGVLTAILLSIKLTTQSLVQNLTREDLFATLKFAFVSVIILPILPRQSISEAPFDVLVPFNIWLMVVFISGISFLGYALIKLIGIRKGVGLTGILGGLASSTAVTMSFSQRSRKMEGFAHPFALAIMLSWTVMIIRVTIEVLTINAPLMSILWLPVLVIVLSCGAYCAYLFFVSSTSQEENDGSFTNPFELRPAVWFGVLYAVVLFVSNVAQLYYGNTGIYISSILSGLVDVDAITLSMARLSKQQEALEMTTAARAIVLAIVSNTVVKGGIVLATGSAGLRKTIIPGILLITTSAIISIFLLT